MKVSIVILLLLLSISGLAQSPQKVSSFQLPFKPIACSIDRQGSLYFASTEGIIEKYDQSGKLLYHFSPQKKATPSLIEAWQGLRVFVYYEAFQEYIFLNRFLTDTERYKLERFNLSQFNGLATLSADNNLWLVNNNTLTLSKIDLESGETLLENVLTLTLPSKTIQPTFIREYQNLLFISDKQQGVLVFDNLGNYMETLKLKGLQFFSFQSNEIVATLVNKIVVMDIYKKTKREISTANLSYQFVFMENNQLIAVSGNTVDILGFN